MELTYKRILLKISGEVLAGGKGMGIDYDTVLNICSAVKDCVDMGVQVGLVVGGGNFWRGRSSGDMDRTRADHMGMLATVMNSLALADALEHLKVPVRVQTAIAMQQIAEPYIRNKAVRHLEKGRVVIFGCGTGNYTGSMLVGHSAGSGEEEPVAMNTPKFMELNMKLAYDFPIYKYLTLQVNGGIQNITNAYQKDFDKGWNRDSAYIYGPSLPRSYYVGVKVNY